MLSLYLAMNRGRLASLYMDRLRARVSVYRYFNNNCSMICIMYIYHGIMNSIIEDITLCSNTQYNSNILSRLSISHSACKHRFAA